MAAERGELMCMSNYVYDQELTGGRKVSSCVQPCRFHIVCRQLCKKDTLTVAFFLCFFFQASSCLPGFIMAAGCGSLRNDLSGLLEMSMCR